MQEPEQLTMMDVVAPVPTLWKCRETCRRFGEMVDHPSWWDGEARCLLADTDSVLFDNTWITWCKLYEEKKDEVQVVRGVEG